MIDQFTQKTQEELKYYVYALIDPRDNKIFYIGKGYGNRVFFHINETIINPTESEKLGIIRTIKIANECVKHVIVRHGLEEREAFLVESVLIENLTFKDFSEVAKITNIVAGHHSFYRGIMTADECEILYNCEVLNVEQVNHQVLLININRTFDGKKNRKNTDPIYIRSNIYEATRGWWVLDVGRARNVEYVLAEYKGVIRAVFKPRKWVQDIENRGERRWGFEGDEVLDKEILHLYLNKAVLKIQGMANPVRYFNV
jgi:hypothetical protein